MTMITMNKEKIAYKITLIMIDLCHHEIAITDAIKRVSEILEKEND